MNNLPDPQGGQGQFVPINPYYNGKQGMLNWAQPYQLSPGQYGHPQGWPNQYQGQSSYSHGYASAPSKCINVQQNSVIQQEKVNNPPCYNVPIANRFTPLSSEQFPALSCESDDEIRAVANPYDVEGAKRQTEMPRLGQIQNFGRKRRDVSPGSNKSYILETKRQNIDKLPKQEFSNVNIPTAEQFTTKVEIEVINKGEVLPPDFDLVKFFKVLLTSHRFEFDVMRGRSVMTVYLQNEDAKNIILNIEKIGDIKVSAKLKVPLVRGIVKGVPLNLTTGDIMECLQSAMIIRDIVRQKRFNRETRKLEDSFAVMVTFESDKLPPNICFCGRKREVHVYHCRIMQCHKCHKYGHLQKDCRAKEPVCLRCSNKHSSDKCPLKSEISPDRPRAYSCANCKGNHASTSFACPVRKQNREILQVAESYQMGYRMAQVTYKSYADAANRTNLKSLAPNNFSSANSVEQIRKVTKQETAEKMVIGLLCKAELLEMSKISLSERIERLCRLVEELELGCLNQQKIASVCNMNGIIENAQNEP